VETSRAFCSDMDSRIGNDTGGHTQFQTDRIDMAAAGATARRQQDLMFFLLDTTSFTMAGSAFTRDRRLGLSADLDEY